MKIVYTMVWPVLIDIKWAPTTKINLHKHFKPHIFLITKISRFSYVLLITAVALT